MPLSVMMVSDIALSAETAPGLGDSGDRAVTVSRWLAVYGVEQCRTTFFYNLLIDKEVITDLVRE